jgi:hypothetical protein
MLGLGKHVHRHDPFQPITAGFGQHLQVAGQRGWMARDIKNLRRTLLAQKFE